MPGNRPFGRLTRTRMRRVYAYCTQAMYVTSSLAASIILTADGVLTFQRVRSFIAFVLLRQLDSCNAERIGEHVRTLRNHTNRPDACRPDTSSKIQGYT